MKPITENAQSFFKRIIPINLSTHINKSFGLDTNKIKIFFRSFCIFIVLAIINQSKNLSLRDLESLSKKKSMQMLSGQQSISHTSIAENLKSIPSQCLRSILEQVSSLFKSKLQYKRLFPKGMKVFDVTSYSVSAKHYAWAAKRQSRANLRFLFLMDSNSGTPDSIIDASSNLNDNKVFGKAIEVANRGRYFVFDKGFNSFTIFKKLLKNGQHFITRWKKNYVFEKLLNRKINLNQKLEGDWILETDEVGILGKNEKNKGITVRKITCRNVKTNDSFIVMADDRQLPANKIVQMYAYRWPIEVYFRHIKSNLHIIHFPSHDQNGVMNWMLLTIISIIKIQLMANESYDKSEINLMFRKTPFKPIIRIAQQIIDHWTLLLFQNSHG